MKKKIIRIDEEKCDGCGICVKACAEGALALVNGKARLVNEQHCDGLGACIGPCPRQAITIIEQEVCLPGRAACGCPGSLAMDLRAKAGAPDRPAQLPAVQPGGASALQQWPVQLHLLNQQAAYFQDADILIAADCVPAALGDFHPGLLKGRILIIFCPKLDNAAQEYTGKLTEIFRLNRVRSVTAAHMEVPCCYGTIKLVQDALKASGKHIPFNEVVVTVRGEIKP
ncbi:MAG TPA: 4Fe-4S binding protein [Candidatus Omnitrophota bacterium]|nr:4Fe-4S binding protein [Candidatus Omnitrophota bacterium]